MPKQERLNKEAIKALENSIKSGLVKLRNWRDSWEDDSRKSIVPSKMGQLHLQSIAPPKMEQLPLQPIVPSKMGQLHLQSIAPPKMEKLHLQPIAPSKMVQLPDPSMIQRTKKVGFLIVQQDNESNKTSSGRLQLPDPSMIRIQLQLPVPFILD